MKKLTRILIESKLHELAIEFLSQEIKGTKFQGKVFLAGGGVRDSIMNLSIKDIDLVIKDIPNGGIEFANWICKKLNIYSSSNPVVFPRFGTAKFVLKGIMYKDVDLSSIDVECVMTRKEKYFEKNRKPKVSQGTLKDDVERRDFTVNSLLQDLSTGEILDLTGMGKQDIKLGIIQTPLDPDIIFSEDPLRMLRAIRFSCKYNWKLPMFMLKAIKRNSSKLQNISSERIQDELNKILLTNNPDKGIRLIQITGLSKTVMPEFDNLIGLKQNKYHKWDAAKHTLEVLKNVPADLKTRLAALFHDIGKAQTKEIIDNDIHFYMHEDVGAKIAEDIMRKLKYPNDIIKSVVIGIQNHMRLKNSGVSGELISDKALRRLKRDLGDNIEMVLDLMHADNLSHSDSHSMPNQIPGIRLRLQNMIDNINNSQHIKLPINGNDLIKIGIKPGKQIGDLLKIIEDEYMENPNLTKEQAIKIIQKYL